MKEVTTRSLGNLSANSATPDGLAMRLRNRIRCSGTPLSISVSTANVAEPPRKKISWVARGIVQQAQLTSCKHGVEEKDPSISNVSRELIVKQFGHASFLVPLDEDFPNANRSAAVAQSLFHGLACTHDRHTTDLSFEFDTEVGPSNGGSDRLLNNGKVVQAFLHQQSNDAVRIEDEIGTAGSLISDHPICSTKHESRVTFHVEMGPHVKRAINWGV